MRYIKQIMHSRDGYLKSAQIGFWRNKAVSVIVHDTVRNTDSVHTFLSLDEECELGFGISQDNRVYVRLDSKSAKLHEFIEQVEVVDAIKGDDFALLARGSLNLDASKEPGEKTLCVATDDIDVRIFGMLGSCVIRQAHKGRNGTVMSMYDLLGDMCRLFKMNIMQYKCVAVYGATGPVTLVWLKHTHEAERFFTKMYIDVTRRGKV